MKTSRAWTIYILVRVLAFIVPFGIVMLVLPTWQWNWLVGVIVGAIVSLAISQIFLYRERFAVAESLQERAESRAAQKDQRRPIDVEEDADIDAQVEGAGEQDASGPADEGDADGKPDA
ncbi:DUF4229 domain-containing protein [Gulosibacter chungangensis]|uniref:DUF4229 domain-containing protein n=1 Tax=Gulosibacter chungangensis TaxID=979746 RepID=A0A7J5BGC6_9MICO|nr:DUF4229 domain-containing protein [Gulosibacter chungangensis]KAB1644952.1 DUF4229 domain-containing protein [Gulosibacter chungangensis]